jgi:hypothetical protein
MNIQGRAGASWHWAYLIGTWPLNTLFPSEEAVKTRVFQREDMRIFRCLSAENLSPTEKYQPENL